MRKNADLTGGPFFRLAFLRCSLAFDFNFFRFSLFGHVITPASFQPKTRVQPTEKRASGFSEASLQTFTQQSARSKFDRRSVRVSYSLAAIPAIPANSHRARASAFQCW